MVSFVSLVFNDKRKKSYNCFIHININNIFKRILSSELQHLALMIFLALLRVTCKTFFYLAFFFGLLCFSGGGSSFFVFSRGRLFL